MQAHAGHTAEMSDNSQTSEQSAVVAVYDTHVEAEAAVRELQKSGFDMQKLSIVGKDYQIEEEVVGYYTAGERMKAWGKAGAFWGGIWGLLFGSAVFLIRHGAVACCWTVGGLDRGRARRCCRSWQLERAGRQPIQHWDSQGQHHRI